MTLRSKLFATVALPVLAVSFVVNPAAAGSRTTPWLMAQALEGDVNGDGQLSEDELLLLQKRNQPAADAEQAQPAAEEAPAEPAQKKKQAAEEQAPASEQPQQEQAPAAEEPAAKPERKKKAAAEEPAAPAAEAPAAPAAEAPAAEEPAAKPERKKKPVAEEPAAPAAEAPSAPAAEAPAAEEPAKKPGRKKKPVAEAPAAEQPVAPVAEAPAAPAGEAPVPPAAEAPVAPGTEQPAAPAAGEPVAPGTEAPAAPAAQNTDAGAPAAQTPATEKAKAEALVAPIPDKRTTEQKVEIAKDPSKTAETVVLPVDNGAAVLDSDKDADNTGAAGVRDKRSKARGQEKAAPAPKTDADAQAAMPVLETKSVNAALEEKGKKVSEAPAFAVPGVTNEQNNTVNNTVNNNTVNNTVNNTTVVNNVNQVTVVKQIDNSTVLNVGNTTIVRSDDRERLRGSDSNESYSERLSRGRSRETIVRGDGTRIVTIYNAYGDVIQRSRVNRDGEEYIMIYAPEADTEKPREIYDAGYDLPPMRLTVPVDDYIVSTSEAPREDYYSFLEKPPVERVERVYSIDEVKYSARIRDKVRRIDLDTITFATGSAEVPLAQAKTLRSVASALLKVLQKDPGETFLIEGHTDAVGSDQSNLVLSDKRAASVAELLTDVYGIPPENLTTQGYGERYLKIRTAGAEQQNRRVTIRRVTALIRPVAKAK